MWGEESESNIKSKKGTLKKLLDRELEGADGHADLVVFEHLRVDNAEHANAAAVVHNVCGAKLPKERRVYCCCRKCELMLWTTTQTPTQTQTQITLENGPCDGRR